MRIIRFNENLLEQCVEFWWSIYKDMPYVHRPYGHQTINTPPNTYGVILGGSLEGFSLQPEIKERIEKLRKEGITIERVTREQFSSLRRLDTRGEIESSTVLSEIFEAGTIIGSVSKINEP